MTKNNKTSLNTLTQFGIPASWGKVECFKFIQGTSTDYFVFGGSNKTIEVLDVPKDIFSKFDSDKLENFVKKSADST